MWASVNHAMSVVFAAYLLPFAGLPAWLQLFAIALPGAVASLLVLRVTSDQPAITRTKNRITANLLALRLFGDDLRVVVPCQLSVLGRSVAYLRYALLPAAVMVVPFSLLVAQVESHYALRGLAPGEAAVLTVTLEDPEAPNNAAVQLRLGPGLVVETPALHVVREASVLWRIRATRGGRASHRSSRRRAEPSSAESWPVRQRRRCRVGVFVATIHAPSPIRMSRPSRWGQWCVRSTSRTRKRARRFSACPAHRGCSPASCWRSRTCCEVGFG